MPAKLKNYESLMAGGAWFSIIVWARVARSEKDEERMGEHQEEARRLIGECGYHRRDSETKSLAL